MKIFFISEKKKIINCTSSKKKIKNFKTKIWLVQYGLGERKKLYTNENWTIKIKWMARTLLILSFFFLDNIVDISNYEYKQDGVLMNQKI